MIGIDQRPWLPDDERARTFPCVIAIVFLAVPVTPALAWSASSIPTPSELVQLADVIVKARAEGLSAEPARNVPGSLGASPTQVEFRVVAVLKGTLSTTRIRFNLSTTRIRFNGSLSAHDEPNRGSVPYESARASADASCFAVAYRKGAEYRRTDRHLHP